MYLCVCRQHSVVQRLKLKLKLKLKRQQSELSAAFGGEPVGNCEADAFLATAARHRWLTCGPILGDAL